MSDSKPPHQPHLHLRYLEIFHEVVVQGSMSDAAKGLGLTQPTVSGHILQLEKDLGVELLDRSHGRARPTAAGELLFRYADAVHLQKQEAVAAVEAFLGIRVGKLVIGASTTPATYLLPALLSRFSAEHPQINVRLVTSSSQKVLRMLEGHDIDLAVVGTHVEWDRYETRDLGEDVIVLVVGKGHPWFGREKCEVDALRSQSFLTREEGSATLSSVDQGLRAHDLSIERLHVLLRLPTNEAIREGLRGGTAAAFLPAVCLQDRRQEFHVIEVLGLRIVRTFSAVWPKEPQPTPAASDFLSRYLR